MCSIEIPTVEEVDALDKLGANTEANGNNEYGMSVALNESGEAVIKNTTNNSKDIDMAPALKANYDEGNTHIYDAHSHPIGLIDPNDVSKGVYVPESSSQDRKNRAKREKAFNYTRPSVVVGKYTRLNSNGNIVTDQFRSATFYDSKDDIGTIPIIKLRALSIKVY